ncbi:MAG: PilT/PilU family type 4a pilus ATPase [Planctomycetota bacterium]|jgi:twitching motility protein PilT|nr:PilT/PilU family type 4a pilus ATPase [Planctomycetota bacterium]
MSDNLSPTVASGDKAVSPTMEKLNNWLAAMDKLKASDLHLRVGSPPLYRVNTIPQRLKDDAVAADFMVSLKKELLGRMQSEQFDRDMAADFSYSLAGHGRYRVNFFMQRGSYALVARRVPFQVPQMEKLGLPPGVMKLLDADTGIIMTVGMTGSGKSTTLASLIDHINHSKRLHIITIEDPIEFLYRNDKSFISQREIGSDAPDFHVAMRSSLRQDPDIILVGEIRDLATMSTALVASETGHLVFGTLHATNVQQTITRVLDFFPSHQQAMTRDTLSNVLQGVMAQKLVPGITAERPLVLVMELMVTNPAIRKYIADGNDDKVQEGLRSMSKEGMQDFNMAFAQLVKGGLISPEVAYENSPNPEQLRMNLRGLMLSSDQATK